MKCTFPVLLLACSTLLLSAADPTAKVGQPLPKLGQLLPGAALPNTSGKVLLVDFWASWCGPCKESFPCLNRLHARYSGKGLVILAIGVDEDAAKHKAFAEKQKAAFPLVHDATHTAAAFFKVPTMPMSYLVDRKGVIRYIHRGFTAKTEAEYITQIEALLAEGK